MTPLRPVRGAASTVLIAFSVLTAPTVLTAQGLSLGASRMLSDGRPVAVTLGLGAVDKGPFQFSTTGQYMQRAGHPRQWWGGLGAEGILRTTTDAAPYIVVGVGAGMGRAVIRNGDLVSTGTTLAALLSAGVGFEFATIGKVGMSLEGRYTHYGTPHSNGITIGARIGARISRRAGPAPVLKEDVPQPNPADEDAIRLATVAKSGPTAGSRAAANVVVTAIGAMGTPYQWGGTSDNGFDCSGLIQYSYAQWGITLPRRSGDQAKAGREVGKALLELLPGDIVTFADNPGGGEVTHVGLYVGNGRFIHSARGGVQVSVLTSGDPVGKWWFDRWVGSRRVVEQ